MVFSDLIIRYRTFTSQLGVSLMQLGATLSSTDNANGIQLAKFNSDDVLPMNFAPPIGPELVSPEELPAAWAYKRFRDLEEKESYRSTLLAELTKAFEILSPQDAATATAGLQDLLGQMAEQGAVVLADIVESDAFLELVARYDEIMAQEGSGSFIHRFVDLRRIVGLLTDPEVNNPMVHPLMITLISYAVGGPIRMVDERAKDAEPLSVLAQDNMLHIDNTPFNDEYKIIVTWRRGTAKGRPGRTSPSCLAPINSPAPALSTRPGNRGPAKMRRSSPPPRGSGGYSTRRCSCGTKTARSSSRSVVPNGR